jgi:hypothetical protein
MDGQLDRVVQTRKVESVEGRKRYNEASRLKLIRIIEKKLQTAFIGALSRCESSKLGDLWAHRKPESELTDEEIYWREIWEEVRNEILNNGNNQIRALHQELEQYTVTWNRYNIQLPVTGGE